MSFFYSLLLLSNLSMSRLSNDYLIDDEDRILQIRTSNHGITDPETGVTSPIKWVCFKEDVAANCSLQEGESLDPPESGQEDLRNYRSHIEFFSKGRQFDFEIGDFHSISSCLEEIQ